MGVMQISIYNFEIHLRNLEGKVNSTSTQHKLSFRNQIIIKGNYYNTMSFNNKMKKLV